MQKSKSDVVSVRIDEKVKAMIEKECTEREITFNKLVCQILNRHVKWYYMAEKMDMITMPKSAYQIYLNKLDIEDMIERMKVIFSVLEGNKIVMEEIQEEIKFIKNIKDGIARKSRGKTQTFKLKK